MNRYNYSLATSARAARAERHHSTLHSTQVLRSAFMAPAWLAGSCLLTLGVVIACYMRRLSLTPPSKDAMFPPLAASCAEHNASCQQPCAACLRYSRVTCARCSRPRRPRCVITNNSHRRQSIRWLHIPKCGATLAVSVIAYACAETMPDWHTTGMALRGGRIDVRMAHAIAARGKVRGSRCGGQLLMPFEGHHPVLHRDAHIVAMFRRPSQRLISAYLDNYHAWGLPRRERTALKSKAPTIAAFARYPGIAGCATKMLAGYQCAERVDLANGIVLRKALSVLRSGRFAFIGLVEEWATSVCLLHAMLPSAPRPMISEFRHLGHSVNSHRDISWMPPTEMDGVYNESVLEGFVDAADEAVYAEASRIFNLKLREVLASDRSLIRPGAGPSSTVSRTRSRGRPVSPTRRKEGRT